MKLFQLDFVAQGLAPATQSRIDSAGCGQTRNCCLRRIRRMTQLSRVAIHRRAKRTRQEVPVLAITWVRNPHLRISVGYPTMFHMAGRTRRQHARQWEPRESILPPQHIFDRPSAIYRQGDGPSVTVACKNDTIRTSDGKWLRREGLAEWHSHSSLGVRASLHRRVQRSRARRISF